MGCERNCHRELKISACEFDIVLNRGDTKRSRLENSFINDTKKSSDKKSFLSFLKCSI